MGFSVGLSVGGSVGGSVGFDGSVGCAVVVVVVVVAVGSVVVGLGLVVSTGVIVEGSTVVFSPSSPLPVYSTVIVMMTIAKRMIMQEQMDAFVLLERFLQQLGAVLSIIFQLDQFFTLQLAYLLQPDHSNIIPIGHIKFGCAFLLRS